MLLSSLALCHTAVFRRCSTHCQNDSATKQQRKQLWALLELGLLKIPTSDLVMTETLLPLRNSCAKPLNQRQSFCQFNHTLVFLIANFLLQERGRSINCRRQLVYFGTWLSGHFTAHPHSQSGFQTLSFKVLLTLTSVITVSLQRCKCHQLQDSKVFILMILAQYLFTRRL